MPTETITVKYVPLSEIKPAKRNAKDHDIGQIIESFKRFGFVAPGVVNEKTGRIVVGHGRAEALAVMKADGQPAPERIRVRKADGEWSLPIIYGISFKSDAEAEAYVLADNRLTDLGGWKMDLLAETLADFATNDIPFLGTGFDEDDLDEMVRDQEQSDGSLLDITNVTVAEPRKVERGDVYVLGSRHLLIVVDVIKEWSLWKDHLDTEDALFCPYPGPWVPLSTRAEHHKLVMVQPDPYVAGHILDRWAEINGEETVAKK